MFYNNTVESSQDDDYYDSFVDDFFEYEDDEYLKSRCDREHTASVKKVENVGNSMQSKIRKLLPLPSRINALLSNLVNKYELEEIKRIIDIGTNSISVHAKTNAENQIFGNLKRDNVVLKIFTRKNHTKPDVASVEKYECSVQNAFGTHCENLVLFRLDNVVVLRMVGERKPAKNIFEISKKNPRKLQSYFREILELIRYTKFYNNKFWYLKKSMRNIVWHENQWMIFHRDINTFFFKTVEKKNDCIALNLVSLVKTFKSFGLEESLLKEEFLRVFEIGGASHYFLPKQAQRTRRTKYDLRYDECVKLLGW